MLSCKNEVLSRSYRTPSDHFLARIQATSLVVIETKPESCHCTVSLCAHAFRPAAQFGKFKVGFHADIPAYQLRMSYGGQAQRLIQVDIAFAITLLSERRWRSREVARVCFREVDRLRARGLAFQGGGGPGT